MKFSIPASRADFTSLFHRKAHVEPAATPEPKEEATPPVTKDSEDLAAKFNAALAVDKSNTSDPTLDRSAISNLDTEKPVFTTASAPTSEPPAKAEEETTMSTAATVPNAATTSAAPAAKTENSFERFIDKVHAFFIKAEPVVDKIEQVAEDAEPILALTPEGPEYAVAVNAILSAQAVAKASIAAGTNLTNEQKAAIAVQAATPALTAILTSKGVTTNTQTHITTWIQNIFNILAGPVALIAATVTK